MAALAVVPLACEAGTLTSKMLPGAMLQCPAVSTPPLEISHPVQLPLKRPTRLSVDATRLSAPHNVSAPGVGPCHPGSVIPPPAYSPMMLSATKKTSSSPGATYSSTRTAEPLNMALVSDQFLIVTASRRCSCPS